MGKRRYRKPLWKGPSRRLGIARHGRHSWHTSWRTAAARVGSIEERVGNQQVTLRNRLDMSRGLLDHVRDRSRSAAMHWECISLRNAVVTPSVTIEPGSADFPTPHTKA